VSEREPVITVRALSRRFGKFVAVDRVSFSVERGEIFGFLGANGAGKSTTIRMLCGILDPTSGEATVAGVDVVRHPARVKTVIGYMSQKFSLYTDLTVEENFDFFGGAYGIPRRRCREREDEVLRLVGLTDHRSAVTGSLPGGFRQRAALACALLHEPPILFLDEPTAGVDPVARRSFWNLIRTLAARGTTIFVTTHYMDEAEYCARIGFMVDGRLEALDSPLGLKRTHVPGLLLEVRGADPTEIRSLPGVMQVVPFGASLHVTLEPHSAPQVATALRARAGVEARVIEPTLEDVFLALSRRQTA
jgi:ABC-2 type transport system ATP-binding protein